MNDYLTNFFDAVFAKGLGQFWFFFVVGLWMSFNAIRSRGNREEGWRWEISAIFCFGIAAVLWQLGRLYRATG